MFFKNKSEVLLKQLGEKLQSVEQSITAERAQLKEINQISQALTHLQTSVQKHDMAIEDLLDTWEEGQSDKDSVKRQFREYEQNEQHLLELFEAYQEQFWNLKRFADTKDETWSAQISLMEKNLEHYRRLCGINVIGELGAEVDYNLYEVIETVDTKNPAQDKLTAEIYSCGYLYKGKVKKKARVSAYRFAGSGQTI